VANTIEIRGDFQGGNPQDTESIIQTGANSFLIVPFSEDEDSNYKFRLDIRALNHFANQQKVHLKIDWREPRFNYLRNHIYLKHCSDPEWVHTPMEVKNGQVEGRITIKPGKTDISLQPRYSYQDYIRFVKGIPHNSLVEKQMIGKTAGGREFWALKTRHSEAAKHRIMLIARIHPYETSGSYCAEGVAEGLLQTVLASEAELSGHPAVCLIPMANPDGVTDGLCKMTRVGGTDLSKSIDLEDSTARLLTKAIDQFQPQMYCEFHNWMFPDLDGIYFLNRLRAKRFIRHMPPQDNFKKKWKVFLKKKWFAYPPLGFKKYCRDNFNSISLVVEYPWYLRSTTHMKRLGLLTLKSLMNLQGRYK